MSLQQPDIHTISSSRLAPVCYIDSSCFTAGPLSLKASQLLTLGLFLQAYAFKGVDIGLEILRTVPGDKSAKRVTRDDKAFIIPRTKAINTV